jgi:uncharacterized protein YndB with AHSA1/START domain
MSGIIAPAPIRKTIHVNTAPPRAFEIFTASMARWWIKTHSINPTKSPIKDIIVEPRTGGNWFERGEDGSECEWGKVLAWEPPARLLLAWQINTKFQSDPTVMAEVEIRFTPDDTGTTVELEHRRLEQLDTLRESFDRGWTLLLDSFVAAIA